MAYLPNRRPAQGGVYAPGQTPPIFDRSQMAGQMGYGGGGYHPGQTPPFPQGGPAHPMGHQAGQMPYDTPNPYQGYGMGSWFQHLGNQFDTGSSIPTGGFGLSAQQKTALNPFMHDLRQAVGQGRFGGEGGATDPLSLDTSGGVLKALQSLGVDTGNQGAFGLSQDQQSQFLHSLQQFVNGINRQIGPGGPPNRHPGPVPPPPPAGQFPGQYSPGYSPHIPPGY